MDEWKNQLKSLIGKGFSLKASKQECCDNCSCQNESAAVKDTDAMGREKFWEDLGRP